MTTERTLLAFAFSLSLLPESAKSGVGKDRPAGQIRPARGSFDDPARGVSSVFTPFRSSFSLKVRCLCLCMITGVARVWRWHLVRRKFANDNRKATIFDKRHSRTGQLKTINEKDTWQGYITQKYNKHFKNVICYQIKSKPFNQLSETAKPVFFVTIVFCPQVVCIARRNSVNVRLDRAARWCSG